MTAVHWIVLILLPLMLGCFVVAADKWWSGRDRIAGFVVVAVIVWSALTIAAVVSLSYWR